jgi:hypothetical protein
MAVNNHKGVFACVRDAGAELVVEVTLPPGMEASNLKIDLQPRLLRISLPQAELAVTSGPEPPIVVRRGRISGFHPESGGV